ncbi:MAG TPA: hypothetical protein VFM31_06600 [Nitrososphaeraceae archaeon]|jgi:hypothetical protein|nr:hypothetical protein [Nitrososphaeraceae archaeon]HJT84504.1 hypothetical protein [Nitrososphaeraceae archaeon]
MPTKVTIELIINDKAFYEYETNETIEKYIVDFQKLAKTFSYVKECNIVCIVREGEKKERTNSIGPMVL